MTKPNSTIEQELQELLTTPQELSNTVERRINALSPGIAKAGKKVDSYPSKDSASVLLENFKRLRESIRCGSADFEKYMAELEDRLSRINIEENEPEYVVVEPRTSR
ncbi:hypothetical protein HYALB_00011708 [Hymenoscyphus albidus]|uniref:Uncharacterized protein n=1 Tax=Hymenoscyphus albidus TaxID=595503 RepID=A0A9N9LR17_9HELO|nr:hypothetical protein HYALB_00011708 [Hymenoscyphus albidus]